MVHKNKTPRRKKRLTSYQLEQVRKWFEEAPMDKKPTIRQIAKAFGIGRPSVKKSLGGWKGIDRGRPEPPDRKLFDKPLPMEQPIELDKFTAQLPKDFKV